MSSISNTVDSGNVSPPKPVLISLDDYITASGQYIARLKSSELTNEVKENATTLLEQVILLLEELEIAKVKVSSGFRPSAVNAATPGSAKRSLHMTGKAVDLYDPTHSLYDLIESKPDLLKKHGLWMEHKDSAPTWVHLDIGTRLDRPIRIFRP